MSEWGVFGCGFGIYAVCWALGAIHIRRDWMRRFGPERAGWDGAIALGTAWFLIIPVAIYDRIRGVKYPTKESEEAERRESEEWDQQHEREAKRRALSESVLAKAIVWGDRRREHRKGAAVEQDVSIAQDELELAVGELALFDARDLGADLDAVLRLDGKDA